MVNHPSKDIACDNERIVLIVNLVRFNCMVRRRRQRFKAVGIELPRRVVHAGPLNFGMRR